MLRNERATKPEGKSTPAKRKRLRHFGVVTRPCPILKTHPHPVQKMSSYPRDFTSRRRHRLAAERPAGVVPLRPVRPSLRNFSAVFKIKCSVSFQPKHASVIDKPGRGV